MTVRPTWKADADKTIHSALHNLMTLALPFKPAPDIRSDVVGSVMVVGLFVGLLALMRLLVAN